MTTLAVFEVCVLVYSFILPRIQGLMWFVLIFKIPQNLCIHLLLTYSFETIERFGDYMIPLLLMVISIATMDKEELA